MQAFVLAAGLGSRLKPLTDHTPKALVEVQGQPLLKIAIDNLTRQGASCIVVNVHHHADQVCRYVRQHRWEVPVSISDERQMLLDTGGGLKKAEPLFSPTEPLLIHNVDVLSRVRFAQVEKKRTDSMTLATLVVSRRDTGRRLLFDREGLLAGWRNCQTGESKWVDQPVQGCEELAFDGIAAADATLPHLLPAAAGPYSIIPAYLELAKKHRINYFEIPQEDWLDVGKPQTLSQAQLWKLS